MKERERKKREGRGGKSESTNLLNSSKTTSPYPKKPSTIQIKEKEGENRREGKERSSNLE